MSSTYNPLIQKIYKSRITILEILKRRGYKVEDYDNFTSNHIQTMYANKQLDLLLENEETGKKIYIKYHLGKKLGEKTLYEFIDDLYDMEDILTEKDDFIIVIKEKMNDTHKKLLEEIYSKDNKYVNIFNLHNFLYNILDHHLVPEHKIIEDEVKEEVKKQYNMKSDYEFPQISRFDPVALAIGLRPGKVCEITRKSPTSIESKYYRLCC